MFNGEAAKKLIESYIAENRKKFLPQVKDSDLAGNGKIYYKNSLNGTQFDWEVNDHTSGFWIYWKDSENGAMQVALSREGTIYGYYYPTPDCMFGKDLPEKNLERSFVRSTMALLLREADGKGIIDAPIDAIDWGIGTGCESDCPNR